MSTSFDSAPERPENIDLILAGLDRYNPETTTIFQDYVANQCAERTYDCYANLALLKLYQFNPHLAREDTITSILAKTLTVFPSADFALCLHLLPSYVLTAQPRASPLADSVQRLNQLNNFLAAADFRGFWNTLRSDEDVYSDLVGEVAGFDELVRVRIAANVSQSVQEIQRDVLEGWLELSGKEFERFVTDVCGWSVSEQGLVKIPINKENEAKGTVIRENVKFDQFSRVVRRAFEQSV